MLLKRVGFSSCYLFSSWLRPDLLGLGDILRMVSLNESAGTRPGGRLTFLCFAKET